MSDNYEELFSDYQLEHPCEERYPPNMEFIYQKFKKRLIDELRAGPDANGVLLGLLDITENR